MSRQIPLDREPWVSSRGWRYADYWNAAWWGGEPKFEPRPGYERDRSRYPA